MSKANGMVDGPMDRNAIAGILAGMSGSHLYPAPKDSAVELADGALKEDVKAPAVDQAPTFTA